MPEQRPFLHLRTANQIAAALRIFQAIRKSGQSFMEINGMRVAIPDMEHFEETKPMTDRQIDKLCDQLYNSVDYNGKDKGPDLFDELLKGERHG